MIPSRCQSCISIQGATGPPQGTRETVLVYRRPPCRRHNLRELYHHSELYRIVRHDSNSRAPARNIISPGEDLTLLVSGLVILQYVALFLPVKNNRNWNKSLRGQTLCSKRTDSPVCFSPSGTFDKAELKSRHEWRLRQLEMPRLCRLPRLGLGLVPGLST